MERFMAKPHGPLLPLVCIVIFAAAAPTHSTPTKLLDIKVKDAPASAVIRLLRERYCAAVSFIEAPQPSSVSLDLRQVTVAEVLRQISIQNPEYRSETIDGREVLYPSTPQFQLIVEHVEIQATPRQLAAELYVDVLRKSIQAFSNLLPPIIMGDERRPVYSDKVSLREKGRVIEHLSDLLGFDDQSIFFELIKAKSGLPSLVFEQLHCAAAKDGQRAEQHIR
jgi:hypothetical protein